MALLVPYFLQTFNYIIVISKSIMDHFKLSVFRGNHSIAKFLSRRTLGHINYIKTKGPFSSSELLWGENHHRYSSTNFQKIISQIV